MIECATCRQLGINGNISHHWNRNGALHCIQPTVLSVSPNSLLSGLSLRKILATVFGRTPGPCVRVLSSSCPLGVCTCPAVSVCWPTLCPLLGSWCSLLVLLLFSRCPPGFFPLSSWCPSLVLLLLWSGCAVPWPRWPSLCPLFVLYLPSAVSRTNAISLPIAIYRTRWHILLPPGPNSCPNRTNTDQTCCLTR